MADGDILLVEDNPGDVRLIEGAFEDRGLPGTVHAVKTGRAALDRLHGRGEYAAEPVPDLVLLDLNLPETSGHGVLESIKSDPRLKRLPVIVLTGSESETDLIRAYENGASAVLIKPADPEAFADRIEAFVEFWIGTAVLPPIPGPGDDHGDR